MSLSTSGFGGRTCMGEIIALLAVDGSSLKCVLMYFEGLCQCRLSAIIDLRALPFSLRCVHSRKLGDIKQLCTLLIANQMYTPLELTAGVSARLLILQSLVVILIMGHLQSINN